MLLNVVYRHSRIKQYLKDGRAMRIETVASPEEQRLPVGGSEFGASFDDLDGNGWMLVEGRPQPVEEAPTT